ncbi:MULTISPECIES: hypothetical protein [unclassified Streptomyces]|uniref:hypothetical protein n=1 Tax=unclassified Streptomyces TaxID=2593676 RepID=UPI003414704A
MFPSDWLLEPGERGNPATRLEKRWADGIAWSEGNDARPLVHGAAYFAELVDRSRDPRPPHDPGGLGDGARRIARELRLELMREHLDAQDGAEPGLCDPGTAFDAFRGAASALDAWLAGGRRGPRPVGRLRRHVPPDLPTARRLLATPLHRALSDPNGHPLRMRRRNSL